MVDINFYAREYENFLSPQYCDELISKYDNMAAFNQKLIREKSGCKGDCKLCNCNRLDLNNFEEFDNDILFIYNSISMKLDQYKMDTGIDRSNQIPRHYDFEVLRIKKYNADEGQHKSHVDVVDHKTARRFLQFCVYLNDDFEEGGTKFNQTGYTVKPKKGKLFVFPPLWPWLHHGQKPIGNNKYFLATYLLYKD